MTAMPNLETERLLIRPFLMPDLERIHVILRDAFPSEPPVKLEERRAWLAWSSSNYEQLAMLHQPPYGDRAIVLKESGEVIGACGFAPCLCPFGQLPGWPGAQAGAALYSNEIGLFYAMDVAMRRRGYTAEAARALIDYGFSALHLQRIVATTTFDNEGSMAVMRRVGMTILKNRQPEPFWFQVVGVLENRYR